MAENWSVANVAQFLITPPAVILPVMRQGRFEIFIFNIKFSNPKINQIFSTFSTDLPDKWICRQCLQGKEPQSLNSPDEKSAYNSLASDAAKVNPTQFSIPSNVGASVSLPGMAKPKPAQVLLINFSPSRSKTIFPIFAENNVCLIFSL